MAGEQKSPLAYRVFNLSKQGDVSKA